MSPESNEIDTRFDQPATAEARRDAQQARRIETDDIKWLMRHKQGRRFMRRLLDVAGLYRPSYAAFTNNVGTDTAFMEGQRNIGLFLLTEVQSECPERYLEMITESLQK